MRSDPMTIMCSASASGIVGSPSRPEPYAAIACTMLPTKLRSCGRPGTKPGRLVAAPDDDVRRAFDLLHLVAVAHRLVAGEVDHLRSGRAHRRADAEQHRVAQPAADQRHRACSRGSRSACRSAPSARPVRPASAWRRDPNCRPSPARSPRRARAPASVQAPVIASPSIASSVVPIASTTRGACIS